MVRRSRRWDTNKKVVNVNYYFLHPSSPSQKGVWRCSCSLDGGGSPTAWRLRSLAWFWPPHLLLIKETCCWVMVTSDCAFSPVFLWFGSSFVVTVLFVLFSSYLNILYFHSDIFQSGNICAVWQDFISDSLWSCISGVKK